VLLLCDSEMLSLLFLQTMFFFLLDDNYEARFCNTIQYSFIPAWQNAGCTIMSVYNHSFTIEEEFNMDSKAECDLI